MKKILLLGGSGFLGSKVFDELAQSYEVLAPRRNDLDLYDVCRVTQYLESVHADAIVNCAAKVDFKGSFSDMATVNSLLPGVLANYSAQRKVRLIHCSSIAVHRSDVEFFNLETPVEPATPYGRTKLLGDMLVEASGASYCIVRFGGIWGGKGPAHLGINNMLEKARQKCTIDLNPNAASAKRNYIHVSCAAKVLHHAVESSYTGISYAGGSTETFKSMLELLATKYGAPINYTSPNNPSGQRLPDQIIGVTDEFAAIPKSFSDALVSYESQ
jgi:dTDP-4-dehydrorhamnose reductase